MAYRYRYLNALTSVGITSGTTRCKTLIQTTSHVEVDQTGDENPQAATPLVIPVGLALSVS